VQSGNHLLIETIYGKRHWCRLWVRELCLADMKLLQHIYEQTNSYVHYLCLVYLGIENTEDPFRNIKSHARLIRTTSRRDLLKLFYYPYPAGITGILDKLGGRPYSRLSYKRLIELLYDEYTKKILLHTPRIKPAYLNTLEKLPTELRGCHFVKYLRTHKDSDIANYLVATARNINPHLETPKRLQYSLKNVQDLDDLHTWHERNTDKAEFPPPPWEGNDHLRPVRNKHDLKILGLKYQNCIYNYAKKILLDIYHVYEYRDEPALATLVRDPYLGWMVDRIEGTRNQSISYKCVTDIMNFFADQGFKQRPVSVDDYFVEMDNW